MPISYSVGKSTAVRAVKGAEPAAAVSIDDLVPRTDIRCVLLDFCWCSLSVLFLFSFCSVAFRVLLILAVFFSSNKQAL